METKLKESRAEKTGLRTADYRLGKMEAYMEINEVLIKNLNT